MVDPIEATTLIFSCIAFIFIAFELYKSKFDNTSTKKFWLHFLMIAACILANRIFTNIEALFHNELFNLLEHLSIALLGVVFIYTIHRTTKEQWKLQA